MSEYWKKWVAAALLRMIRTFAESALAYLGTAAMLSEVNWLGVLSAGGMGALISFLMALKGLPEVPESLLPTVDKPPED